MNEEKIKHLEFIQNIINRMNTNSFQIKGLTITIVSALLAVYASTSKEAFIFLAILPTVLFWGLDSYYLLQERKFRAVYNDITGIKNMFKVKPYEMPINKYTKAQGKQFSYWNVFFSKTILWLYLLSTALLIIIGIVLIYSI